MVSLVFAMQAAGLVVGPLIAVILLAAGISTTRLASAAWLGAIPSLSVFYCAPDPRDSALRDAGARTMSSGGDRAGDRKSGPARGQWASRVPATPDCHGGLPHLFTNRRLLMWLIGASGAWFMLDFSYYGNTIASPEIIKLISPNASLTHSTLITLLIFVVAAVPGYALAILLIDRMGRRSIQTSASRSWPRALP